jgi:hypothetical protein
MAVGANDFAFFKLCNDPLEFENRGMSDVERLFSTREVVTVKRFWITTVTTVHAANGQFVDVD